MRSMTTAYGQGSSIDTAPTETYSATTPASRRLISSMKRGGNDHSLPTSKPTRFVIVRTPSVVSADVALGHLLPVRPVVVPAVPDAQRVANPLVPQHGRKLPIVFAERVVAAHRQDDVLAA